jgi:chemotaxis protein methyltransferase WspC
MKPIEERLRETIGLDPASVGPGMIQRAVRQRMRGLGLKQTEDYRQILAHSRAEWQALVESVVVTESWFFRDPGSIAAFVRLVRDEWSPAYPTDQLRLLSRPCSSGEEPFSLVMALLDAGLAAERFQIEAVDISARSLARTARAVYGKNAFRGKELSFRDRYFQPSEEGFLLNPAVRNCVRLRRGNLLSEDFLTRQASYDFIFCRNLLIYFDPLMRQRALDKLQFLLAPAGVLFVGAVEQPLAIQHGFVTVGIPLAFACRKAGHGVRRQGVVGMSRRSGDVPRPEVKAGAWLVPPSPDKSSSLRTDLEMARRLADAGRLEEAAEICEAHLRQSRISAQAYFLLGLVRNASGESGAIDCYRKALYLEPNHYESLLQMALALQKNGEAARARAFKSRAQRLRMKLGLSCEHFPTRSN